MLLHVMGRKSRQYVGHGQKRTALWLQSHRKCHSNTPPENTRAIPSTEKDMTHFGFKTIPKEQKEGMVGKVFRTVADSYDVMNDSMSFGVHRIWKDQLMDMLGPVPGTHLLDVAGGTGDIAFRFIEAIQKSPLYFPAPSQLVDEPKGAYSAQSKVTILDINPAMLEVGKKRLLEKGFTTDPIIEWIEGNAENLSIKDNTADVYTIAFGIRNCTNIEKVIREAFRVLKPGGRFLCLEFSHVHNPILGSLYDLYSFNVIPVLGHLIAGDWESYQYLIESIRQFPNQETFKRLIEAEDFKQVTYTNLIGGIAAIHSGFKL